MTPKCYIMIGIPGSGKTTWLLQNAPNASVCSADHFHTDAYGKYNWKPETARDGHNWCLDKFIGLSMESGNYDDLAVDNTNTTIAQIAPYIAIAQAYGYEVVPVYMSTETLGDTMKAGKRNVHSVPMNVFMEMHVLVNDMIQQWPSYWPPVKVVEVTL
jgi:predicted kinase